MADKIRLHTADPAVTAGKRIEFWKNGAPGRIRTRDPLITNQVLYQLSYKGSGAVLKGKSICGKAKFRAMAPARWWTTPVAGEPFAGANGLWLQGFIMYHWRR